MQDETMQTDAMHTQIMLTRLTQMKRVVDISEMKADKSTGYICTVYYTTY